MNTTCTCECDLSEYFRCIETWLCNSVAADATCTDDASICTGDQTCVDGTCTDPDSSGVGFGLILALILIVAGITLICIGILGGKC